MPNQTIIGPWRWLNNRGSLTQRDIYDGPFTIFPRPTWRKAYPMSIRKFCFPFHHLKQGEFIPNDQIIDMLRIEAQKQGKPVTIIEDRPRRWALWFTILGMVSIFGVGIVLNWVK